MNVGDLLDLDLLRDAGVTLVAGREHLGRDVRWVHTGEIADIARYLTGGEVLLTAATGLARTPSDYRRYIRELVEVGAAGVIIELGRGLDHIPAEMIQEAGRGEFVLASLDSEVPFVAVTHLVHTELISSAHATLLRATDIEDELGRMIVEGATLPAMLETLSAQLSNPVVLEDASHRVVAYGRATGAIAPVLRRWREHSRSAHRGERTGPMVSTEADPPCAWTEVMLRGERWGRLHVLAAGGPLDDVTNLVLGRMASTIALHLMSERDAYLSDAAEETLVRGLALEQDFDGQAFVDRATGLGIDLEGDLVMLSLAPAPKTRAGAPDPGSPEALAPVVRAALARRRWASVVGTVEGAIVAVASAAPRSGLDDAAAALMADLSARAPELRSVGVSRTCRPAALPRALSEARVAHRFAPTADDSAVQMYDELVLHRLLAPLVNGPELAGFVESELGALIGYDAEHNAELVRTLDAYLQANGSKIATASLLHLRRRSVYYRLERLEQILGHSIDAPDRRARLYVALRARELLGTQLPRGT